MLDEFNDCFALGLEAIPNVELPIESFVEMPSRIRCWSFYIKHKNKIKIKFMAQHKTQWKMPMYACPMSLTNLEVIFLIKPTSWN